MSQKYRKLINYRITKESSVIVHDTCAMNEKKAKASENPFRLERREEWTISV